MYMNQCVLLYNVHVFKICTMYMYALPFMWIVVLYPTVVHRLTSSYFYPHSAEELYTGKSPTCTKIC